MASTRLVFQQPRHTGGNPVPLVFGAGGQAEVPSYAITARGRITVGLRGQVRMASVLQLQAKGRITGLRGSVAVRWNVNVSRPMVGSAQERGQDALPRSMQLQALWQQSKRTQTSVSQIWQDARHVSGQVRALWQQAQAVRGAGADSVQDAAPMRVAIISRYQEGQRRHAAVLDAVQDAAALQALALVRFEEAVRLRSAVQSHFQRGQAASGHWLASFGQGRPVSIGRLSRFEEAMRPGPGVWQRPPPQPPEPCYVPGLPAKLIFKQAYAAGLPAHLVFRCCKSGGQEPQPVAQYVIPLLRVYMQVHTLTAHLLPGMEPVQLTGVTIATNDDSCYWSLSASGPEHLMEQLAPVAGLPARLRVVIDGIPFVFAVMSTPRSRAFGQHRVQVNGVSTTALLAAPYMPAQVWSPTAAMTAQQIALQALEFTGVGLSWDIDDWAVPGGAFSYQGTPLQAVMRVAESVGAVLRSHRTEEQLIVAPRYPVLPWEWAGADVQVQMPAAVIVTDDLNPEPRAAYNAVYVTGGPAGGVHGHVVRAGTAGEKLAPQIQDDLITQAVAARMRGSWALAASGNKLMQTINMPVLTGGTNPGVLQPGQLLEVADLDGTWRGLVRGVSVSAALPKVRQQVTVERVAA